MNAEAQPADPTSPEDTRPLDMTVMLVSFSEQPAMQRYLYVSGDELLRRGVNTYTIGSSHLTIEREMLASNLTVDTPATPKPSLTSIASARKVSKRIVAAIRESGAHLVHFVNKHTWNYFVITQLRKDCPDVRVIHTLHDPVGHDGDSIQRGVVAYHRIVQRLVDAIVVHSRIARRQTLTVLKPDCPVYSAPLGTSTWLAYSPPEKTAQRRALIFGRINAYKGCQHYPAICREIFRLDPSITITIAGRVASEIPSTLLAEIVRCPNVELHNRFIDDAELDEMFRSAGIVLTPYTSITQSGVILDAYSRSRSVVAFDIDGIDQYIDPGNRLVSAFDCRAFAHAVTAALHDPAHNAALSYAAWSFGQQNFTPVSMVDRFEAIYRDVTAEDGSARMETPDRVR